MSEKIYSIEEIKTILKNILNNMPVYKVIYLDLMQKIQPTKIVI